MSLHLLEIWQNPRPIEVCFGGGVEAEVRKPRLAGHGGNPVLLEACWRFRADVNIHRAVGVFHEVGLARGTVGLLLLVLD